jgi:hypothetical protein
MRPIILTAPLLVLSLAPAQSVVSPGHFTSAEASSQNRFPFGETSQLFRYLQVHDDLQGTPRPIRTMTWRRGAGTCGTACTNPYPAYTISLNAWCSTATTTATTLVAAFDTNHGTDKVQVITSKTFNFPATSTAEVPAPFVYRITFDVPFIYLGMAPLCWEVQVTGRTNATALYFDAASGSSTNPPMPMGSFGAGCTATGRGAAMTAVPTATMSWGTGSGSLVVSGANAPANGVIVVLIGFRKDNFGGIPLPFLLPGTSTAPSGPCSLHVAIALVMAGLADAGGRSTTTIPVPATLDLNGGSTFEQILALDPAANSFGVVLSNAVNHNFLAPYGLAPVGRVYLNGSHGASGAPATNEGLVTLFAL